MERVVYMKKCIFNSKKQCNECGECDVCDYNKEKKCDNCAMCLELQGYDTKAIGISNTENMDTVDKSEKNLMLNELLKENQEKIEPEVDDFVEETIKDVKETETTFSLEDYNENETDELDENVVYLDDVEGLAEIMNDPEMKDKIMNENYPGLLDYRSN